MSAYLVPRAHIATLAVFGAHTSAQRFGGLVGLANLLATANAESMDARYQDEVHEAHVFANEAAVYDAARIELTSKPLVMLKAINCLEYQSCEHGGWKASDAAQALEWLASDAIRALPGYEDADGWSIEDLPPAKFGDAGRQFSLSGLMAGAYRGKADA